MVDVKMELVAGATSFGLIFLFAISALYNLLSSLFEARKYGLPLVYVDKDGISTEELTAMFTTTIPKIAVGSFSCLGFIIATALAILGTLGVTEDNLFIEDWINAGSWVCFALPLQDVWISADNENSSCSSSKLRESDSLSCLPEHTSSASLAQRHVLFSSLFFFCKMLVYHKKGRTLGLWCPSCYG